MNKNKGNNASNLFEQIYKPSEQHFDLEARRDKNINKINELVNGFEEIDKIYAVEKRNAVNEAMRDTSITNKDEYIETKFSEINTKIEKEKKELDLQIKNLMIKQAKYMLMLKAPKDAYEYYKLISTKPLDNKYSEVEQKVYREFLMRNPALENIIISYSELNVLSENTIEEVSSVEKKDDAKKDDVDSNTATDEMVAKNVVDEATAAVEKARKTKLKDDILAADKLIEELSDSKEKKLLVEQMKEIKIFMFEDFKEYLRKIGTKCLNEEELIYSEVDELRNQFDQLVDVEEKSYKKVKYASQVADISETYNSQAQNRYKLETAEKPNLIKFSDRVIEFSSSLLKGFIGTEFAKKYRKRKLQNAKKNDNKKQIKKWENKIKESDIINSVRLFASTNRLEKLKPALYKGNILDINPETLNNTGKAKLANQINAYEKSRNRIDTILYNGLNDLVNDQDILEDKDRILTVISQNLRQLSVSNDIEKDLIDFEKFLVQALKSGSINEVQLRAYMDEAESIRSYMDLNDNSIYELNFDEIDDNTIKYYEKPILYKDADGDVKALPHVKTYNRK